MKRVLALVLVCLYIPSYLCFAYPSNMDNNNTEVKIQTLDNQKNESNQFIEKEQDTYNVVKENQVSKAGNIYTSLSNIEVDINFQNKSNTDKEANVTYYVKDHTGDIVWKSEPHKIVVKKGETVSDTIKPVVSRYDIYTISIEGFKNTGLTTDDDGMEFAVVNAPTKGVKSKFFGTNAHVTRWSDWDKIKEQTDILGIGYLRTVGLRWSTYETSKGVYGGIAETEQKSPGFYREVADMGIKTVAMWSLWNPVYTNPDGSKMVWTDVAKTEEALAALEEASARAAADYKGLVDIWNLGNEANFKRVEELSPEEYGRAMYAAYKGLKRGNPDCYVISMSVSRSAADWTVRMLQGGEGKNCDAVAIHLYQEAGSPESKKWWDYHKEVRDALDAAGFSDVPIWGTEGNTSSSFQYNTEQQQGVNLVREFAEVQAYNLEDKYMFYEMQTKEKDFKDNEDWFGILRGRDVKKNANVPKQAYLATANYLSVTENVEYEDSIQEGSVWIHRFKKGEKHVVMMYADRNCENISLNLGATSGILYDINGNSEELYSDEGYYTFTISDQPMYFEYVGEEFKLSVPLFYIDKNSIELTKGSEEEFTLSTEWDTEIECSARDNLDVSTEKFGTMAVIKVKANKLPKKAEYEERRQDYGTEIYRDFVSVKLSKAGKCNAWFLLPVNYAKKQADVKVSVIPHEVSHEVEENKATASNAWALRVEIKNNNSDRIINGTINMKEPKSFLIEPVTVTDIFPNETAEYFIDIPEELTKDKQKFVGELVLGDRDRIEFSLGDVPRSYGYKENKGTKIKALKKADFNLPVIDGVIEDEEWLEQYKLSDFNLGKNNDSNDFSGTVYAMWDNEYLYTAAIVKDDIHWAKQDPVRFYYDDLYYLTLAPTVTQRHDTRIDMALSDFYDDNRTVVYRNYSQMFDVVVGGVMPQSEYGVQGKITRNGDITVYELRMPWSEIVSPETFIGKNTNINLAFNIRDYENNANKTFSYGGWFCLTESKK